MLQEPAQKLFRRQSHGTASTVMRVVLPTKGDVIAIHRKKAMIRDGHKFPSCICKLHILICITILCRGSLAIFLNSFITQRGNRVDSSGPSSREVACDHSNC